MVLAFAGAALALRGSTAARPLLIAAALAGVVTAMALWIPAGVVIGAAAVMLGQLDGARDATPAHRAWGAQRVLALAARSGHDALCDRRQAPRDHDGEGTITVAP